MHRGFILTMGFLAGVGFSSVVHAAPPELPEGTSAKCGSGSWKLEAAPERSKDDAGFNSAWQAELDNIVACLRDEQMERACVLVQGQYDATPFEGAADRAVGGQSSAQSLRATGRAQRVRSWLYDAGVAPRRIQEVPPPAEPSWRGVLVELQLDCLPPSDPVVVVAETDPERVRAVVVEKMKEEQDKRTEEQEKENAEAPAPREIEPEDPPGPWWVGVGTGFGGLSAKGADDVVNWVALVGVGRTGEHSYMKLGTGVSIGSQKGQARGLETSIGLGWHALDWLLVGVRAGHRISAAGVSEPWADQVWFGGVEGAQCLPLTSSLDACVEEFMGGGRWSQRAVIVQDRLFFVPTEDHQAFLFGLGIGVRERL